MHVVERLADSRRSIAGGRSGRWFCTRKAAVIDWHAHFFRARSPLRPAGARARARVDHETRISPLGRRATIRAAALINGAAAHTLEVDDIFPKASTIPGRDHRRCAPVAQSRRASGEALLRAVIVGYEISSASRRPWAAPITGIGTTPEPSAASARRACSRAAGLDRKRFAHALATVATFSAGLQQAFRTIRCRSPCTRDAR